MDLEAEAAGLGVDSAVLAHLRSTHLHVAMILPDGRCHEAALAGAVAFAALAAKMGVVFLFETLGDRRVALARNRVCAHFLADPEATHLLFLGADVGFQGVDVLKLLCADVDLVGGTAPVAPARYACGPALELGDVVATVRALDARFLLVRRRVLERMAEELPLKCDDDGAYAPARAAGQPSRAASIRHNFHAFFEATREGGSCLEDDATFCSRWRQLGGQVFLHLGVRLDSYGIARVPGDLGALRRDLAAEQAQGLSLRPGDGGQPPEEEDG